jgi:hypothetical protein
MEKEPKGDKNHKQSKKKAEQKAAKSPKRA